MISPAQANQTLQRFLEATAEGTTSRFMFGEWLDIAFTIHWIRRTARLGPDGTPPPQFIASPEATYLLSVLAVSSSLDQCIHQGKATASQVETPPPTYWLGQIGMSQYQFDQHLLDTGTVTLHSALDRGLLFVNAVLEFAIEPRLCSYDAIKKKVRHDFPQVLESLSQLRELVSPLASSRHHYVHRGESRTLGMFSAVRRLQACTSACAVPMDGVLIANGEARNELLNAFRQEVTAIESALIELKCSVREQFAKRLTDRGCFSPPTSLDHQRFVEVMEYFQGGVRPVWMD